MKEGGRRMKYIWTLVLGILLMTGYAVGQVDEPWDADEIIPYDTFMDASLFYLWDQTPAFAGAWGDADAYAGWCPELEEKYGTLKGIVPVTITAVNIYDPTYAENTRVDPSAGLNMSAVAIAALAGKDGAKPFDEEQVWMAYGQAGGKAFTDVQAIDNAWTIATIDAEVSTTPWESLSSSTAKAYAIADFDGDW
jgi:hypothetical protein